MKATGSKLIKVAEGYGRPILKDVDTGAILVDVDGKLIIARDAAEAFDIAAENQAAVGFDDESKSNSEY